MKEAANIDYRLDPIVTEACLHERNVWLIQKDADDTKKKQKKTGDCLRLKFKQRKINTNSKCYGKVRRIYLKVLIYLQILNYTKLARQI